MKLYLVWGIEFHIERTLLGVYESNELAYDRFYTVKVKENPYDDYKVEEIELNTDL